ncbi:ATP:cob(I)alamin adenosyltransferase [Candidatus Kaiserbacteria bacterium CG10_big_fil_rev_8_21_14_0_10_49_17]|uniref:Corrinoid adenosyltransferase n=1 Tax=Candidatus Kaiserbacteria bacterium CG10_big_fil_rev_8_21_14_0_10_49_17 TaxID=1974609 RepID=A0A2M6WDP1_9BACT|nr:MAG: ATP:cob(I)alamin adenosyltransferase [Candidatus Kaiserbacteria bacterium CG10_big_fil_rev_8_21_14_0_10_49_17]
MTLFTGKGDDGTTKTFDSKPGERISKASAISEALGTLDELNSFLGLSKVESEKHSFTISGRAFGKVVHDIQENLFTIQAELVGAEKTIAKEKLRECEAYIYDAEKELPPITTFFISGGTELAAQFDVARTLARRAERRVVAVVECNKREIGEWSRAYLNRLSSLLYALARLSNHKSGISEESPKYE